MFAVCSGQCSLRSGQYSELCSVQGSFRCQMFFPEGRSRRSRVHLLSDHWAEPSATIFTNNCTKYLKYFLLGFSRGWSQCAFLQWIQHQQLWFLKQVTFLMCSGTRVSHRDWWLVTTMMVALWSFPPCIFWRQLTIFSTTFLRLSVHSIQRFVTAALWFCKMNKMYWKATSCAYTEQFSFTANTWINKQLDIFLSLTEETHFDMI